LQGGKLDERKKAYRMAIENEIIAQNVYSFLADSMNNKSSQTLFERLILMEKRHQEKVTKMFKKEYPEENLLLEKIDFPRIIEKENLEDGERALQFAIRNEEKAAEYYEMLAKQSLENDAKQLFEELAHEERNHKKFLEDEISRLNGTMIWFDDSELNGIVEY
jgi:rubrerythrin